ncbi:hypothetical protein [Candidatus Magnetominusculus xianensis]|uniref:Uncharacterized protein n=1 Tax=Candidatus Magnetominusculus xianensis TaxID=1748249 RepID=A0ABR5SHW6_9BACT|nr:hypothetical protein [Candidatus Magnetominusculus xianensis]KWT84003.1 hypothetical protein ASN18_2108 [Candidatus Magnetominusculus xianensis]MBF0405379.1 hypothetical protein [Nitrospirota bacterium]
MVIVEDKKVADMTAKELKALIIQTIHEAVDPDFGLELRPETECELLESITNARQGKLISVEDVVQELGFTWE